MLLESANVSRSGKGSRSVLEPLELALVCLTPWSQLESLYSAGVCWSPWSRPEAAVVLDISKSLLEYLESA